ncbi:MAG: N-acetylmuramoyl-L-alanine amidase [Anaerolineae bacterium]|nr:N-acetylmuramoyl-L-alanine amidase [Anaerolineae bacterium]
MKKLLIPHFLKWAIGLLLLLIMLIGVAPTLAHQLQRNGQPDFSGVSQAAANGNAVVELRETHLDVTYFAKNGRMDGVTLTPTGLHLAEGESRGSYTSGIIHSPLAFTTDIVPLWEVEVEQAEFRVETRLTFDNGASWTEWQENPEAFYPVRDNLHGGHLIWVGRNLTALQFRVTLFNNAMGTSSHFKNLTLVFSDTSQGPNDSEIAGQMSGASTTGSICPPQKPPVVSRTHWGCPDGQHSPRRLPLYHPVTHVIIHQAETPNHTDPYYNWASWVRSVWNYHTNVLGWGDVGYNYLIDPNGVIYEGRAGGDDVVGIHDRHNYGSMAIGFLGCYGGCDDPALNVAEPDQMILDEAANLIAWKLGQKDIDPFSSGPYGHLPNVPVIAGGQDVAPTTSPGDSLYIKLPELRAMTAEKIKCELQTCQITGFEFDKEIYNTGETIDMNIWLADSQGMPLIDAQVEAKLTRHPLTVQPLTELLADGPADDNFLLTDEGWGKYVGHYAQTESVGAYHFTFTARDPTGERFLSCIASPAPVVVVDNTTPVPPSATPTPTITPGTPFPSPTPTPSPSSTGIAPTATPTATPSPTPTPDITGPIVKVIPENLIIPVRTTQETTAINIENVSNLAAVHIEVVYDPNVLQVLDANEKKEGVQVWVNDAFANGFIAKNIVDSINGRITVAVTLIGSDKIDGNSNLITVDWQPKTVGVSNIVLENLILANVNGQVIPFTPQHGRAEVVDDHAGTSGVVTLQGRTKHSGILVTNSAGQQTQTQDDGSFFVTGNDTLKFQFPGYLSAQANVRVGLELSQIDNGAAFQTSHLEEIILLAGDINADDVIDILDLAYIASAYASANPTANLNADSVVDIFDLVIAAGNYGKHSRVEDWK